MARYLRAWAAADWNWTGSSHWCKMIKLRLVWCVANRKTGNLSLASGSRIRQVTRRTYGSLQVKFAASSMLPEPLYCANCG
jgi:hypothetical protein